MEDNNLQKFVKVLLLLMRLNNLVKDRFFFTKLNNKIYDFTFAYLQVLLKEGEDINVAQYYILVERSVVGADLALEYIKELEYLKLLQSSPLLLQTELDLLTIKLETLKKKQSIAIKKAIARQIRKESASSVLQSVNKEIIKQESLTPTKKKILEYIKSFPNTRTKDIIFEFSALSDRTVKRNLIDLIRSGLIKKRIDNKAVYYYSD